jgi:hypothetical protein
MARVLVLVEGQTEETFIRDVLGVQLASRNVFLIPTLATTKRAKGSDGAFKGGIVSYAKVANDISRLLHDTNAAAITTMIDFYGTAGLGFPGADTMPTVDPYRQVTHLEQEWRNVVPDARFRPYFMLHEFEAMLFTDTAEIVGNCNGRSNHAEAALRTIANEFDTPELINTSHPPSKRIQEQVIYDKVVEGPIIAELIGLERIREACTHFAEWLSFLESLAT